MEFKKPDYIKEIHPAFKKYFSKKYFDGQSPYPPTVQEANKYVLFEILEADDISEIQGVIPPLNEGESPEEFTLSYPRDYYKGFNFYYWQHLTMEQKVIMLYWLSEDITSELEISPIDFCFLTKLEGAEGLHMSDVFIYQILINPNSLEYDSSYDVVNTIAHELNHAQFSSVLQKQYMNRMNNNVYWSIERTGDTFEDIYEYIMYFCQPIEITAEIYAYRKVCEIFKKGNQQDKTPSLTDLVCINEQKTILINNEKAKHVIFGDNFNKHLDLYFLLRDIEENMESPRISLKRADELARDLEAVQAEIEKEKKQFKKNYIKFLNSELSKANTTEFSK